MTASSDPEIPPPWEFWIDVGGTFTDCLARSPQGRLHRYKLLSTGVVRGRGTWVSAGRLHDPARQGEPPNVWAGYGLRALAEGTDQREYRVESTAGGQLQLSGPAGLPTSGVVDYELYSDEEAPIVAIRYLLGLPRDVPLPAVQIRLGTTRGTNALLTRRGARVAFLTTRGFGDLPMIGNQNRPRLFELGIQKPKPLFSAVVEVDERVDAQGAVVTPLSLAELRDELTSLRGQGFESLAVCFMHAYRNSEHEREAGNLAAEMGFTHVSLSHQVAPIIKMVARGDTTLVNAYLNPVLQAYVDRLRASVGVSPQSSLRLLSSAGGLMRGDEFSGKDSILSGPAGGVVGCARVAQAAGFSHAIGFDMGGTSTDVSRFDGHFDFQYETEKAGVRIVAPMMAIETVAAGGGSICRFDGVKLVVGPDSAGADPGPACYGRGGPLTVTDVNLFLGRIPVQQFPFPLDLEAVEDRLAKLQGQVAEAGQPFSLSELADGFRRVANANMAHAIRSISVAKGYDPRDYVLVSFGGAAGQHACAIADDLGIPIILNHPDAGILSALGIGLADVTRHRVRGCYLPLIQVEDAQLQRAFDELVADAQGEIQAEGIPPERTEVRLSLDLRFVGLEASINIPFSDPSSDASAAGQDLASLHADAFHAEHQRRFGYTMRGRAMELVNFRVEVVGRSPHKARSSTVASGEHAVSEESISFIDRGEPCRVPVFDRRSLAVGSRVAGPAVIAEPRATTVVDAGWEGEIMTEGELLLRRDTNAPHDLPASRHQRHHDHADPILLELFNNQFAAIAEQMGITLRNTSCSVNVKERLDFSCAIFTSEGDLVVNAPHIPVHLGAMSETVKAIIRDNPALEPGDVLITNDPYRGGSHLPDITVVTPVHDEVGRELRFFTASRAHHAEIGGTTPGSMPPFSQTLADEGVLIRNLKVVARGESRLDELQQLLSSGDFPSRAVHDNLADVGAQIAANRQGVSDLRRLTDHYGWDTVSAYMQHIQQAAARKTSLALTKIPPGRHTYTDQLDEGARIAVAVERNDDRLKIDFTGTGEVLPGNLNANRAIVTAAMMYCLRCLIDEDIPLNQGVLEPIDLVLPQCLLNPPAGDDAAGCAAVAGGNVETSQRVVDVLLAAFELAAASQGTMNNFLFGDESFGYYETICGGEGATRRRDGADAVHTHMTNTRITDPEILEHRYPVRLMQFSIRPESGGPGLRSGGNGVIRRLMFLAPLDVSLLTSRRTCSPFGLDGGSDGAAGSNHLIRRDGAQESLGGSAQVRVDIGDQIVIATPGGGGWGVGLEA